MNKEANALPERAQRGAFLRRLAEVIKRLARSKKPAPKSRKRTEQE
jgi:hypothetical protein